MSTALKQNSDFQPTALEWLGEFPSRWQVEPGLAVLQERQVKNIGLVEPTVLSLSYGRVVIKPQDKLRGLVPESFETYQIVEPGNIIIRPTDLQNDHVSLRVGQAKDRGIITSAYMCLETKGKLTEDYAHLLLHAYDIKKVFYGLGSGLRQNLSWVDFRRLPIPVPPPDEQAQIVRFIRHLDHRVNQLIKTKRRLIELLNEQKQAIIHRAVTRGLDPTVPLKPSGIDWLEEIPAHWNEVKVKWAFRTTSGGTPNTSMQELYYGGSTPWIRTTDLTNDIMDSFEIGITDRALRDTACKVVSAGTVLVAMYGGAGTIGKNGLLTFPAALNQAVCGILPNKRFQPEFLFRFMQLQRPFWMVGADGTRKDPNISQGRIRDCVIIEPPLSEQAGIVTRIAEESREIDRALQLTRSEIDFIREYRTRLVADVVTGQLDVRHLDLPEVEESLFEAIDAHSPEDLELEDEETEN
ncbi:MAG: restriction endonuclease subunit S [Fimbriimonadaceae bacterium]|nr:restriction endonuclease subunit S [Fimbriimonadaceae bacterium]QYK55966.1 MAG: restriction endonuclease subunit S [Fimbriimonadaceae bacterium]